MRTSSTQSSTQNNNKTNKMAQATLVSKLNVGSIGYDKIKPKGKGKIVHMNYNGSMIRLQIPNTRVPFGLSTYENEKDGSKKYSMELTLGGNSKMDSFREKLESLDNRNVDTIVSNGKAWLGEDKTKAVVEGALYGSLIKPDKKGESPPRFKIKLPIWEGKPMFTVYDSDHNVVKTYDMVDGEPVLNWDWAQNGMEIRTIAECEGLWVVNKNVYCTWRAVQIHVTKKSNRLTEFAFQDEDDDADDTADVVESDDNDESLEEDDIDSMAESEVDETD